LGNFTLRKKPRTSLVKTATGAGRRGTRMHGFAVCENDGKRRENKYDLDSKLCLNRGSRRRRSRRHSRSRRRVDRSTPRAPRLLAFAPRSAPRRIASHARLRREIQPPASVRAFKSAIAACRDPRPARPPRGDTRSTREPPPVTRTPHTP
jgi:hypothetical protein